MVDEYISLDALASRLHLPKRFLRECAARGDIPCLEVGGRLRFSEGAVAESLRRMARSRAKELAEAQVEAPA